METYKHFVEAQRVRNPCLLNICTFFSNPKPEERRPRIASLDFFDGEAIPRQQQVDAASLPDLLVGFHEIEDSDVYSICSDKKTPVGQSPSFRLLIVEDLSKEVVETLGSSLNIDPLFFALHIHSPKKTLDTQTPDLATLPSRTRPRKYINIQYHRTVVFENAVPPANMLFRDANLDRKVIVLPWAGTKRIGLAQHCVSVLHTKENDCDIGLILVDPPITDRYFYNAKDDPWIKETRLRTQFFLGGYEDFIDPSPMPREHVLSMTSRLGLFDNLLHYWTHFPLSFFTPANPTLAPLAFFPLKIVAAEWTLYAAVMHKSVKQYEYSGSNQLGSLDELERLHSDMRALQRWRRRTMSSQQKIQAVLWHMGNWGDAELGGRRAELLEDYGYLASSINGFGRRLENMLPVVTSLVQVIDSRRSFAETANITRLTVLALIFVPLNYTSSLFSMMPDKAPGGEKFWVYFTVAVPITVLVFLIAQPPFRAMRVLVGKLLRWRPVRANRRASSVSNSQPGCEQGCT